MGAKKKQQKKYLGTWGLWGCEVLGRFLSSVYSRLTALYLVRDFGFRGSNEEDEEEIKVCGGSGGWVFGLTRILYTRLNACFWRGVWG